ncbi:MAG: uroporphyrinogen decarboxylase family protein, partial [Planctomycetota bacterium]
MARLRWARHADLAIEKDCSVRREEYLDYMTFAANERPLFTEYFGPMVGLKEEWLEQGATPAELDFSAFRYRCPMIGGIPVRTGFVGGAKPEIVEETDEYVIRRNAYGQRLKLIKGAATLPLPLDYPVANMDDWLRLKPHYEFSEERFADGWGATAREHLAAGRATRVAIPGGFSEPRNLMGDAAVCLAYYEQPELMHDMLDTFAETACRVLDRVSKAVPVDILGVHEDMAGNTGPLAGPKQVEAFIAPYYRKVWDLLRGRGARLFDQDSDGNIEAVIPAFLDAGLNMIHPVEPAAGMDPVALRERYGRRLAFAGGLDKHVVRRSREEIVAELEYKIPPLVASGGCLFSLDPRVPNGTPLANYRFYVETAWAILER